MHYNPTGKTLKELQEALDKKKITPAKIIKELQDIVIRKIIAEMVGNENNFEDMDSIISKMETDYNIDMDANEIVSIVKAVDSFEGIAREYGIDAEHVYVLKANFR